MLNNKTFTCDSDLQNSPGLQYSGELEDVDTINALLNQIAIQYKQLLELGFCIKIIIENGGNNSTFSLKVFWDKKLIHEHLFCGEFIITLIRMLGSLETNYVVYKGISEIYKESEDAQNN